MSDDKKHGCNCPYCDTPLFDDLCKPCGVTVKCCPECGKPLPGDAKECPDCGAASADGE